MSRLFEIDAGVGSPLVSWCTPVGYAEVTVES